MDSTEQIKVFEEFLATPEQQEVVLKIFSRGLKYFELDFQLLSEHDPEIALMLLSDPQNVLINFKAVLYGAHDLQVDVRVVNVNKDLFTSLKDVRTEHIDKLLLTEFEIESASESRPVCLCARYECPSCGNVIPVVQTDEQLREPSLCGSCGRKGKFKLMHKELVNQIVVTGVQPLAELFEAGFRSKTKITLRNSLADKNTGRLLAPAGLFEAVGVLREEPVYFKNGSKSVKSDYNLHLLSLTPTDTYRFNLDFSAEEVASFDELVGRDDYLSYLSENIFYKHHGDEKIKLALTLQLMAGSFNCVRSEENLHVLLVSDPATGKTQNLLLRAVEVAPIGRYSEATKSTRAGLVGSVGQSDPRTGARVFEFGALPRANKGLICIDEISALPCEDLKVLNESMATQRLTFDKQNIHTSIPSDVRVLGAMNPVGGRFDDFKTLSDVLKELNEQSFVDRFGLIFAMRDTPSQERDLSVAMKILGRDGEERLLSDDWIKRFLTYVRASVKPVLRDEERLLLEKVYVNARSLPSGEGQHKLSPRFLEAIRGLTLLVAKAHLRSTTCNRDVVIALDLMKPMLKELNYPEGVLSLQEAEQKVTEEDVI